MKVKVLQLFVDQYNHTTRYEPGTVHEFDDERAKDLVERGLAEEEEKAPLIPLNGETEEAEVKTEAEVAPEVKAEEVTTEVEAEAEVTPEVKTPQKAKK